MPFWVLISNDFGDHWDGQAYEARLADGVSFFFTQNAVREAQFA